MKKRKIKLEFTKKEALAILQKSKEPMLVRDIRDKLLKKLVRNGDLDKFYSAFCHIPNILAKETQANPKAFGGIVEKVEGTHRWRWIEQPHTIITTTDRKDPNLKPNLGCATTEELLDEIKARIEVDGKLDYRTIDSD